MTAPFPKSLPRVPTPIGITGHPCLPSMSRRFSSTLSHPVPTPPPSQKAEATPLGPFLLSSSTYSDPTCYFWKAIQYP
jgi:hypothetical protein